MSLYFITAAVVGISFFAGRFLVPFVLYNKPAQQFMNRVVSRRMKKDEMSEFFHRMRFLRDMDSVGGGIFAALAFWILETTRGEWNPLAGLLGLAVTGVFIKSTVSFEHGPKTERIYRDLLLLCCDVSYNADARSDAP
jgi:hypothetical protein